jgi:hypothetical protein
MTAVAVIAFETDAILKRVSVLALAGTLVHGARTQTHATYIEQ